VAFSGGDPALYPPVSLLFGGFIFETNCKKIYDKILEKITGKSYLILL